MIYSANHATPLGPVLLASDGERLVGLWFPGQKYFCATVREPISENPDLPIFSAARGWLDAYFSGARPAIADLPLAPAGGAFRRAVWDILCEIPYGAVTTYGAIAKTLAARLNLPHMSAQAVGGAVGHNPVSIVIPCHRVVGSSGGLTGYAGGIEKKEWLLGHEGTQVTRRGAAPAPRQRD